MRGFTPIVDFGIAPTVQGRRPMPKFTTGFTIIETLLVLALLAIVLVMTAPVAESLVTSNDLKLAEENIVETARRAQILARGVTRDLAWGVKIGSGSVTLFGGDSFAARDGRFDEVSEISGSITLSGTSEVVFRKVTGYPKVPASITLTSVSGLKETIIINEKGTVSY